MKRTSFFIAICLIISLLVTNISAEAITFNPQLELNSSCAYMENLDTGDVVFAKDPDKQMYPASLTKIMTAIILLDTYKGDFDKLKTTKVVASQSAVDEIANQGASNVDIRVGEELTCIDLLYSLMLPSACDSAAVIADTVSKGNTAQFVQKMNDKAKALGCKNTKFSNPHGLFEQSQVTTVSDLAKIIKYARNTYPKFMKLCNTYSYTMAATNIHPEITYTNRNPMIDKTSDYYYKYAQAIKTGFIDEVGRNLATIAEKDGVKYLVITMGAPESTEKDSRPDCADHITLYEWAFNSLHEQKLLENKAEIGKQEVAFGKNQNFVLVKPAAEYSTLWMDGLDVSGVKTKIAIDQIPIAPIKNGDTIGKIQVIYNGNVLFTTDAIAVGNVKRNNFDYYMSLAENFVSSNLFVVAIVICLVVVGLYSLVYFANKAKSNKQRQFKKRSKKQNR